jgi:hypothetical protein
MKLEEMLNNEKNKKVSNEFHNFFEDTLKNLPDKKKKRNFKFSKALAVIILFLVVTPVVTTYGSDILKNIFAIKDIIKDKTTSDLYVKYTKDEPIKIELGDYKIIVNNIGYDDNFLVYVYSIERKDGKDLTSDEYNPISVSINIGDFEYSASNIDTKIESNKFSMAIWQYIGNSYLDEISKAEIVVTDFSTKKPYKEKRVKLELEKSKATNSKSVKLDKEIKVPEGSIYLDEIVFSPFAAIFKSENRGELGDLNRKERDPYYYAIFDENGYQIWMGNSQHSGSEELTKISKTILPSEYIGKKKYTIKVYDSRTSEEVENSAITIDVPEIN